MDRIYFKKKLSKDNYKSRGEEKKNIGYYLIVPDAVNPFWKQKIKYCTSWESYVNFILISCITCQIGVRWAVLLISPALFDDIMWGKAELSIMRGSGCSRSVWNIHQVLHQSQQVVTNLLQTCHHISMTIDAGNRKGLKFTHNQIFFDMHTLYFTVQILCPFWWSSCFHSTLSHELCLLNYIPAQGQCQLTHICMHGKIELFKKSTDRSISEQPINLAEWLSEKLWI